MEILKKIFRNVESKFTRGYNCNQIDFYTLQQMIRENNSVILLDVRSPQEFKEGHLLGAINIPLADLKNKVSLLIPNHGQIIIVYCQMGGRSRKASNLLNRMGYTNIYELNGGLDAI